MSKAFHWGVMGTGNIAGQFAAGVQGSRRGKLAAVGSRSEASARAFAERFAIPAAHGSYEALLADPTVEGIYLSLPNALHHAWTLKALAAGKHVLCEKPFAVNAAQAQEMFDAADKAGLVLVEAFMYRSHPLIRQVVEEVRRSTIGQLRLIRTSFCFNMTQWQGNVRFSTELAGGGLMDVGCYCISFSRLLAGGEPTDMHVTAHLHESGVDDYAAGTLTFPNGVLASFVCGMTLQADNTAYLCGSDGYIAIPIPWKPPEKAAAFTMQGMTPARSDTAARQPMPRQTVELDAGGPLYGLEADDFAAAVQDGQAVAVTRQDTLGNMRVLDALRRQAGLGY